MPISYRIDRDASLVRVELSGKFDIDEIRQTVAELLADAAFQPGLCVLNDLSQTSDAPTAELVSQVIPLLHRVGERIGRCRSAVIAPRDATYGMVRMAEVYAQKTPIVLRAFRTQAEAERWLREGTGGQ